MNELLQKLNDLAKEYKNITSLLTAQEAVSLSTKGETKLLMNIQTGLLDTEKEAAKMAIGQALIAYRNAVQAEIKTVIAEMNALI